jgi:hypothetical protein
MSERVTSYVGEIECTRSTKSLRSSMFASSFRPNDSTRISVGDICAWPTSRGLGGG